MYALLAAIGLVLTGQVAAGSESAPNGGDGLQQIDASTQVPLERPDDGGLVPLQEAAAAESTQESLLSNPSSGGGIADPYGAATSTSPAASASPPTDAVFQPPGEPRGLPQSAFGQGADNETTTDLSAASPASQEPTVKPGILMREMLTPPPDTQLSGVPITLAEVVERVGSRAERSRCIEAYWDLCSSTTDYYLGLREQQELKDLRIAVPRIGATLQMIEQEVTGRTETARLAALSAQYCLASLIGSSPTSLPLPHDVPHCGSYHSHYEEIFAARPSPEAGELNALLPLRHAELKAVTAAIERDRLWVDQEVNAAQGESDGSGAAIALELLALRRRAFVQLARDYNRRIARYCELATPGEIASPQLVSMLIRRDPAATLQNTFASERETTAGTAIGSANRDSQVERASAESPSGPIRERSLLVTPP